MTLVFIFWGSYGGFKDVLACAMDRANCPIYVISDQRGKFPVQHLPIGEFQNANAVMRDMCRTIGPVNARYLARWFILQEFGRNNPKIYPVMCMDWDVMIFRDLAKAYAPFMECDYTVSMHSGMESAAYGVNHEPPLVAFCNKMLAIHQTSGTRLNDMEAWSILGRTGCWKIGNLFEIHNRSVFDHNMHSGASRFQFDGPAKRIDFDGGNPFFTQTDGTRIAANTIHCWGTYKSRTEEVRRKAGIKL